MTVICTACKNVPSPIGGTLNNDMYFWNKLDFAAVCKATETVPSANLLYLHRSSMYSITSFNLLKNAKTFIFVYIFIKLQN